MSQQHLKAVLSLFGVTILGNNSALPAFGRHPTAQVLTFNDQIFLIDCGEGTQMQFAKYRIRRSKINHIFISHLHGDHYFGLIGLITSMGLLGRETPLHIYGPAALQPIIESQLKAAGSRMPFPLQFIANRQAGPVVSTDKFTVSCFPVKHRIECWGYLFTEKKLPRKLLKEKAIENGIPAQFFHRLTHGEDFIAPTGEVIPNEWVTSPNAPGRTYAYCADTCYDESLCKMVEGVSLLYHETTYLKDVTEKANIRFHCTTEQAANIAALAGVKKLIIGHFSSKYEDLTPFLEETKAIFPETELAIEGVTFLF